MVSTVLAMGGTDCERLHPGWLAQPANAVSSLAYLAVGVWLLRRAAAGGGHRGVLVSGGGAFLGVGVGSLAYHGPQPGWADFVHAASVVCLVGVVVAQTAWLGVRSTTRRVALAAWKAAGGWMVLGLTAYTAGRTGSWLCDPGSLWQPHAAWHVLSALGLGQALRRYSNVPALS